MKILSGIYRGIKIDTTNDVSYRPTKSRVRKSIFDVISPFDFSSVLDLFSGTGILGFESISRGASAITFVEKSFAKLSVSEVWELSIWLLSALA